jgi:hypothetical protein
MSSSNALSSIVSANPLVSTPSVGTGATANQAQWAAQLALDAGVIATFGATTSMVQTYNAVGVLNGVLAAAVNGQKAASTTPSSGGSDGSSAPPPTTGNGSGGSNTTSGSSTPATGSTDVNANWARLLKSSPAMAYTAVADSVNQGLIASLRV